MYKESSFSYVLHRISILYELSLSNIWKLIGLQLPGNYIFQLRLIAITTHNIEMCTAVFYIWNLIYFYFYSQIFLFQFKWWLDKVS